MATKGPVLNALDGADEREPNDGEAVPDAHQRQRAVESAIRLLARREHSSLELRRKLESRGHAAEMVEGVVAEVVANGFQSDARFAESFVRSRLARGQGMLKIRAGLRDRGIDANLVAATLDLDDDEWCRLATGALRKRFGDTPPHDHAEWAKRARFLARRGFSNAIAARVVPSVE